MKLSSFPKKQVSLAFKLQKHIQIIFSGLQDLTSFEQLSFLYSSATSLILQLELRV